MTHSGGKPHAVGDKGQRYEVRCKGVTGCDDDAPTIVGWSDTLKGVKSFVQGIDAHPSWHSPTITDRELHQEIDLDAL